jgi:hypothetical protein
LQHLFIPAVYHFFCRFFFFIFIFFFVNFQVEIEITRLLKCCCCSQNVNGFGVSVIRSVHYGRLHHVSVSGKPSVSRVACVSSKERLSNVGFLAIVGLMALLATGKRKSQRPAVNDFAKRFPKVIGYQGIQKRIHAGVHVR